jgi:hypothetical protein
MRWLTTPTRGRVALWLVLALLWLLLLPQDHAIDPDGRHFSALGAVLWAATLAWLLGCAWSTWRRYRRRGQGPR